MTSFTPLAKYRCLVPLNLYNSPHCEDLATQAAQGRHLTILSPIPIQDALEVRLCEDGYKAWLPMAQHIQLKPVEKVYRAIALSRDEIEPRLAEIIAFASSAMAVPNYYLWGGTIAPNYDCSGLIQAAFAASGIWLPRDSYQQEEFTQKISFDELLPGDLIFFGKEKVNHVALYLGKGYYIHSSGKTMGRNGIEIDPLSDEGDEVSRGYFRKLWGYGRVRTSYQP